MKCKTCKKDTIRIKKLKDNCWLFSCMACGAWSEIHENSKEEAIKKYKSLKNVFY